MTKIKLMFKESVNIAKRRVQQINTCLRLLFREAPEIGSGPGKGLRFDAGHGTNHGTKLFISGQYERPVQDVIFSLVKPGDVCYDIGANLGFFSVLFSRLVGNLGMVYAFEPVPANASMIERNVHLNRLSNIKVLKVACSRESGRSELLLAVHVGGAVLKSAGVPPDLAGSLMVDTVSVDTLVVNQQIKPPNFVKIDVEGAEIDVLQGMEGVLREWVPTVIVEVDAATTAECRMKLSLCREFFHDLHYQTEILPNSYADGKWFVRHFLATRKKTIRRET